MTNLAYRTVTTTFRTKWGTILDGTGVAHITTPVPLIDHNTINPQHDRSAPVPPGRVIRVAGDHQMRRPRNEELSAT
ncbi:hypothetical protein GII33_14020 [Gordonia pseudamarae]|uniref:Uncharacterized protein n=1 Tax=Gordonia pseudamarae TaxID=2831662 RepID=A0ABX6IIT0_9ACTN|nr:MULTISPECIES: hypothetical protein [Gordonia]MBD0024454.1 hypothetical protein [Gordonia sp. (in: high G+C Gram-positive bacteria)]QHN26904.1 hypothetical protein GII33_14020 [Gordonia pseudamarae]QHN35794.1 hypothetical protein GII31_13845 [Gordonia pseudamarae]